ncbi:MAG: hypothetical protein ACFFAJ_05855 [Candidatus Hodarchaeota archaeon]
MCIIPISQVPKIIKKSKLVSLGTKEILIALNDLNNDMEKKDYFKYMFLSGAIRNVVLGIVTIVSLLFMMDSFITFGIEEPPSLMFYYLFFGVA